MNLKQESYHKNRTLLHCSSFIIHCSKTVGFTLIELLVVILIVGILMGLSLVGFGATRKSARDSKRKADLEQIRSALEIYRTDCKTYPAVVTPGEPLVGVDLCVGNEYMSRVPTDPLSITYEYRYKYDSANKYYLCAYLEITNTTASNCSGKCGSVDCNYEVTSP